VDARDAALSATASEARRLQAPRDSVFFDVTMHTDDGRSTGSRCRLLGKWSTCRRIGRAETYMLRQLLATKTMYTAATATSD
jgi:hypothetical protein